MNAFKSEMKELDAQYYQQKQHVREQLAGVKANEDMGKPSIDSSSDYYQPINNIGILN